MTMANVPRLETVEDMQRLQNDLIHRMATTSIEPGRYEGLADCGPDYCGRGKCIEACWLGTRRRRLFEIARVYRLFERIEGPAYEVRIIRRTWPRPIGRLHDLNIAAI